MSKRETRRVWFFEKQDGICALGISEKCKARARLMVWKASGKCSGADCTWEHVFPRHAFRGGPAERFRVLACQNCNTKKGGDLPSAEYVAHAYALCRAWFLDQGRTDYLAQLDAMVAPKPKPEPKPDAIVSAPTDATPEQLDEIARRDLLELIHGPKRARAEVLGVTDPAYLPGAKRLA